MSETNYRDRTDSLEEKIELLTFARDAGNHDVALSLAESIKDTLICERQMQLSGEEPTIGADTFALVDELPTPWAQWARGWQCCKHVTLSEEHGLSRAQEPVDLSIAFRSDQTTDLQREVRVARVDTQDGILREVPSQIYGDVYREGERRCRLVFFADVEANRQTEYLIFYGNPAAELPRYPTDLDVEGEGFGLNITNHHYTAQLSRQMGQLERLIYKQRHGLELFAGGEGHGEPPNIDWAHDYLASNSFQKFRVTNWSTCPNYEVVQGPLCVKVKRWGFPHSPAHPLFTPSRIHITVTYTFYAGLPYFTKVGSMDVIKDLDIEYLRDDEWVFSGYSFTDTVWMDADGKLHEGEIPREHQDNLWGVGFFHNKSRDAFVALWLEHRAQNFDPLYHSGAPVLNYQGHGQLWSRWAARNQPHFRKGASLKQKNAYLIGCYPERGGAESIQALRERLLHPLVACSGTLPRRLKIPACGVLARPGEDGEMATLKREIWESLCDVQDDMFYRTNANVVDMGYIYDVRVRGEVVTVLMTMPHRGRPKFMYLGDRVRERLLKLSGVRDVLIDFTWEPAWTINRLTQRGREAMGIR